MIDPVEDWLNSVAYSHSQSKATELQYKRVWERFSNDVEMTAEEIIADYEHSNDRNVMRKHARLIRSWIGKLMKEGLTNTSIKVMVGAVKSFYKYNDLPLGHVPQAMSGVVYHNRDITKEEIVQIMAVVKIREKAFFAVMAQSGLRPHTIKQLRLKHLEDFETTPCKIEVPQNLAKGKYGRYVTFVGPDALKYLKLYFATRKNLTPESLLFCAHDDPQKPVNVKDISRAFRLAARKLEKSGALDFKIREGKPSELRLYNLRKFFRKYANQMGFENVNYLMGHTVRGSDENYKPQDPDFYRELYAEKAMPFLRLETSNPLETEKAITSLEQENRDLQNKIKKLEDMMEKIYLRVFQEKNEEEAFEKLLEEHNKESEKEDEEQEKFLREEEEYLAKHPEERKRRDEAQKAIDEAYSQYLKDHAEEIEEQEKFIEEEAIRLDERRKTLAELQDIINKAKEAKGTPNTN
jgi:site-specific recombinase XerC